jgi:hypothetical protein
MPLFISSSRVDIEVVSGIHAAEQRYCRSYERAATCSVLLYTLTGPWARSELKRRRALAIGIAQGCISLIAQPLERYWNLPLVEVRSQFGVRSAKVA